MNLPVSTYRIQLNSDFTFEDAGDILDYLSRLGITHIYASPVFRARKGSTHGYDMVNPQQLNPEIGSRIEFDHLMDAVKQNGLGWIQDIVPNHMAIDSGNVFLMELLENGPGSPLYTYFDIEWNHPYEALRNKLLVPILGDIYGDCLERQEIQLSYDRDGFFFTYYEHRFPLRMETYASVLGHNLERLKADLGTTHSGLIKLLGILYIVKTIHTEMDYEDRKGQVSFAKAMLWELYSGDTTIHAFIEENIKKFNGVRGDPESFELLDNLHSEQFFKLSYWKVATEELNYRRFFTVNDLISVRVEDEGVFADSHAFILDCVKNGLFTGLRIDHIDGLYNPVEYLNRLREHSPDLYIIVEKILGFEEYIREDWPVQGTTGYDFLNMAGELFCLSDYGLRFQKIYQQFTGMKLDVEELLLEKKRLIIRRHMAGDIDNLALLIKKSSRRDRRGTDMTLYGLRSALVELLAAFPVYRTYINSEYMSREDTDVLKKTFAEVRRQSPAHIREIEFIEKFLFLRYDDYASEQTRQQWLNVLMRFQQFTGPLMAKGFEDTTLYNYNRMTSLNEVGGYPEIMGVESGTFHTFASKRQHQTPLTLNASSTHDTKRGEDTRMRISVLSEFPKEWEKALNDWSHINRVFKKRGDHFNLPDNNDEYFLYQTLLGTWPFSEDSFAIYVNRIQQYMLKAVREAKFHTGWITPDTEYEGVLHDFINNILDKDKNARFFDEFKGLQSKIAWYGVFNSLSLQILKNCAPGVPDYYRGTELWDFSLVDPDNRRPVDFDLRRILLSQVSELTSSDFPDFISEALENSHDARIKMFIIHTLLNHRNENSEFYECAHYEVLRTEGRFKRNLFAFRRHYKDKQLVVIVPRFLSEVAAQGRLPLGTEVWRDSVVKLRDGMGERYTHLLTGKKTVANDGSVSVGEVFGDFPGAVLFSSE
ncbi:MAG: malto-oligosyltrehalose synthase [Chitinispirillaceae bacterium]